MQVQAVFVGGIHGAGKTSICQKMHESLGGLIVRQRHLVIEAARGNGLSTWEEIGPLHDKFIKSAASLAVEKIKQSNGNLLLIDCHFSIRTAKALRARNKIINGEYIPDLDRSFVSIIGSSTRVRFILISANPSVALERFSDRPRELLDYDNTLEGLIKSERVGNNFFLQMINDLNINPTDYIIVDNNGIFDKSAKVITKFITDYK